MKDIEFACKLAALLIIAILIINLDNTLSNVQLALSQESITTRRSLFPLITGILFFVLNAAAAYGLYHAKKWGFIFTYAAILFSSIVFSTIYVPFATIIFSKHTKIVALVVSNLMVFYYVFYYHLLLHKKYWK